MNSCKNADDCFDHGDCVSESCMCDLGWFGNMCSVPGTETWGSSWGVFLGLFISLFCLLLGLSVWKLYVSLKSNRWMGSKKCASKLVMSPKNVALLFIVFQATLRILWLSIDPLRYRGAVSRLHDRLVSEIVYPLIYGTFSCVLLVWGGLYQGVARHKEDRLRPLRRGLFIAMILAFPVCLTISTVKGLRVQQVTLGYVSYALICVGIVVILSGLLVFGWKLHRLAKHKEETLSPHTAIELSSKEAMVSDRITGLKRSNSVTGVFEAEEISSISMVQSYDELIHPRASLPIFTTGTSPPESKEPTDVWSVSSASYRLESKPKAYNCWSMLCTENISPNDQRLSVFSAEKEEGETDVKNSYLVLMTDEDQGVLRQILVLITMSAVVGGVDIVVSVFFALAPSHYEVSLLVLASLYVTFGLEFLASGLVLVVFTTTIKVRSKESLQFLAKVRLMQIAEKSKNATISAPKGLPHIAKRLLRFLGAQA